MPVVVRTREYGSAESYSQLGRRWPPGPRRDRDSRQGMETPEQRQEREIAELF